MKEYSIVKTTNFKKVKGEWVHGLFEIVIDKIEAKNRTMAFKEYINKGVSSSYSINNRDLTMTRQGKNKKRRTEIVSVVAN